MKHDWKITVWEYDSTFFRCVNCDKKTWRGRGYPDDEGCCAVLVLLEKAGWGNAMACIAAAAVEELRVRAAVLRHGLCCTVCGEQK